jgi:ABC-type uncharacterized transport system auxiliary subunit
MTRLSRRRAVMLATAALAGCSVLPARPYQERREWPLDVAPPVASGGPGRKVLLLRALRAGPGMDTRGLRTIQPDGAERIANWEEWAVPPPQGVEEDLRQWLAASGLYAAVTMPGSTVQADLVLEGELLALAADPQSGTARAAVAVVLLAQSGNRPLLQRSFVGTAKLQQQDGPAQAAAMRAAIADMLGQVAAALAVYA